MILRVKLCVVYVLSVLLLTVVAFVLLKPAAADQTTVILVVGLAIAAGALGINIIRGRGRLKDEDSSNDHGW